MPVFRLCLRIIKGNIPFMLLFIGVFLGIAIMISGSSTDLQRQDFSQSRVAMALFAPEHDVFAAGLRSELAKTARFVAVEDDAELLHDAIFNGKIRYVLRVPEGFNQAIRAGHRPELQRSAAPEDSAAAYLDRSINQYVHTLRLYASQFPEMADAALVARVAGKMAIQTPVRLINQDQGGGDRLFARTYFNYLAYSLFAILILGISANIMVFNKATIRQRNACAPLSQRNFSLQLLWANMVYALLCWLLLVGLCLLFVRQDWGGRQLGLFLLNSLLLCFWAACASFWIGHLAKSRATVSAATNLIAMATSFISGVFVPQELLGAGLLRVASFTPTYWYVLANNQIAARNYNGIDSALAGNFALQIGFGLAFLALALVTAKSRQRT